MVIIDCCTIKPVPKVIWKLAHIYCAVNIDGKKHLNYLIRQNLPVLSIIDLGVIAGQRYIVIKGKYNINLQMVKDGYALASDNDYKTAENDAKKNKRGMWK